MTAESLSLARSTDALHELPELFRFVRSRTEEICAALEIEDYVVQTAPYMSPPRWHLGHTTWFFEMVLKKFLPDYKVWSDRFLFYFNSYYEGFGIRIEKQYRGTKSRPTVRDTMEYRQAITERMHALLRNLDSRPEAAEIARLVRLGLEHEMQHQELLVYDIKHLLCDEYQPTALHEAPAAAAIGGEAELAGGLYLLGYTGEDFAYDNEMPEHTVFVNPFAIDAGPVRNADYLEFIEAGGYRDYRWWLSEGWAQVQKEQWEAPLYWEREGQNWMLRDFRGVRAIPPEEPVTHISYYEAAAYAKWAGKRLPSEAEWEYAALYDPATETKYRFPWGNQPAEARHANLFDNMHWGVVPAGAYPAGRSASGCYAMIGNAWEWTASDYAPYPGFTSQFAEYNDKWFINQKVLRGGSFATPRVHIRGSYRNFFHPEERWMICGFRCARTLR